MSLFLLAGQVGWAPGCRLGPGLSHVCPDGSRAEGQQLSGRKEGAKRAAPWRLRPGIATDASRPQRTSRAEPRDPGRIHGGGSALTPLFPVGVSAETYDCEDGSAILMGGGREGCECTIHHRYQSVRMICLQKKKLDWMPAHP